MDNAKAAVGVVELPTGVLSGEQVLKGLKFRELAGPEEDILASNMPASQKMTEIMANCTMEISGVLARNEIKSLISKLVITDRWFYLVQLRSLSFGSAYLTDVTCPACQAPGKETIDLNSIQVKNPPNAKELYGELVLPKTKRKIRWKVADGETDLKIEKMANQSKAASVALFARVTEVDDRPAAMSDVIDLPMSDRAALRKAMDDKEGEFDDEFDVSCQKCGHAYKAQMQLDGKSFFSL